MMNEILAIVDDLKKIKTKLVDGDMPGAIKLIDECIAYKENEVKVFETWLENENKLEGSKGQSEVEEQYDLPFPEATGMYERHWFVYPGAS